MAVEGLSHVSSQPAMIPSSRSILSRDKRLPLDIWNTSGLQENVFGNQFSSFDSPRNHHQGMQSCAPERERGPVPQATATETLCARDDKQSRDTIPMPTFARRPSTHEFYNTGGVSAEFLWLDSKDSRFRNCGSTTSLTHNRFWCGKFDSKHK